MTTAAPMLEQVNSLLSAAVRTGVRGFDDESLVSFAAAAEQVGRLIDALRVQAAAEIDERSRYELGRDGLAQRLGETRGVHLLEKVTRVSQREAARRVQLGRATRVRQTLDGQPLSPDFPTVANALSSGMLGLDAAAIIVQYLTQASQRHASHERVAAAEAALVEAAAALSADLVAVRARVWREALDPDGAEPRDEQLRERRQFWVGREQNGLTKFGGYADPTNAALLRAALAERTGPGIVPRFLSAEELAARPAKDPRTTEQRNFDIMMGLITAGLRSSEGKRRRMRSLTTVVAVVNLKDLENATGIGWLDDVDEPVSVATIKELVCDGGVRILVLGENGEPLYLGRTERLFSKVQRLALSVRDGGCVWNGCHAPPGWCHAHHVIEYANGGKTDINNGANRKYVPRRVQRANPDRPATPPLGEVSGALDTAGDVGLHRPRRGQFLGFYATFTTATRSSEFTRSQHQSGVQKNVADTVMPQQEHLDAWPHRAPSSKSGSLRRMRVREVPGRRECRRLCPRRRRMRTGAAKGVRSHLVGARSAPALLE